jgi:hypothetical protein
MKFSKENIFWLAFSFLIISALFFFIRAIDKKAPAPPAIGSRYELNILAKKHGIPIELAHSLFKRETKVLFPDGRVNWPATIEKISLETGIKETVISAFLVDMKLIYDFQGSYAEDERSLA